MLRLSVCLLLLLSACEAPPVAPEEQATVVQSGLERAAIESGVIADPVSISPVGLFQRRHEAGIDKLCVRPGTGRQFRFGVEAVFGAGEHCRGTGLARRAGDKLILRFLGAPQCIVVAQYDGDRVAMPGVVDLNCARLCGGRGSLEGVSLPRLSSDAASALAARDRTDGALCD